MLSHPFQLSIRAEKNGFFEAAENIGTVTSKKPKQKQNTRSDRNRSTEPVQNH